MRKITTIALAVFMLATADAATAAPLDSGLATTAVNQLPPPPPPPRLGKLKLPARPRPKGRPARRPAKLRVKLPPPPPKPPVP